MDPKVALAEIRALIAAGRKAADGDSSDREFEIAAELRDAVESLDEWLSAGGFLPVQWQVSR